jgi:hypothetical protein
MVNIWKSIIGPFTGIIAFILGAFELLSALSRINTGLKIFEFAYNSTSDVIVNYHAFTVMRDGFYAQIYNVIFTYVPFLNDIPDLGWNLIKAVIFLAGGYIIFKLCLDI